MNEVLNAEKVTKIFMDCLFREGENTSNYVLAEGITITVGFHPGRLNFNKIKIEKMLEELPTEFKKDSGGWSFLNSCNDKNGEQWTGLHRIMEQLMLLGIGIGKIEYIMSRPLWSALPGGMPYFVVNS